MTVSVRAAAAFEGRSIDPVPEAERHGRPRSLFTLWFAANMQVTAAVTGALTLLSGLPIDVSIALYAALSGMFAVIGYWLIHRFGWLASALSVVVFVYLSIRLVGTQDLGAVLAAPRLEFGKFLLALSLTASWQLTFRPYVAV
ncbi:cytosine permease [Crossiella sp. SN42]|uniref:cytosine permease n=1 Tax=Crossiella sp. SN42 TaxID=2944808 RepID=UPI00207C31DF|nr:cytosine permease [Crossiella sp. SN42]MCO1579855.1 cytosine permease [Crossiella sp. SN42]